MFTRKKIVWLTIIVVLVCFIALFILFKEKSSNKTPEIIEPKYILATLKHLTSSLAKVSFRRDGYSVTFKEKSCQFEIVVTPKDSERPRYTYSSPNETLKFKDNQTLSLENYNYSITICKLGITRKKSNIFSLTDTYLFKGRHKNYFAYFFLIKDINAVNKEKIKLFFKNKSQFCTQETKNYFIVLPKELVQSWIKVIIATEEREKKQVVYKKQLMKKHNLKTEEEFNKYAQKINNEFKERDEKQQRLLRELTKKADEATKLKIKTKEKLRREKSRLDGLKITAEFKRKYVEREKARKYINLNKEQAAALKKSKKEKLEKSLAIFKEFETPPPKTLKEIKKIFRRIKKANNGYRLDFMNHEHIPNYDKLKKIYPDSDEAQLLDAVFEIFIQNDTKAAITVLNKMKNSNKDPRFIKMKLSWLPFKERLIYVDKLLKEDPENEYYLKVKKYILLRSKQRAESARRDIEAARIYYSKSLLNVNELLKKDPKNEKNLFKKKVYDKWFQNKKIKPYTTVEEIKEAEKRRKAEDLNIKTEEEKKINKDVLNMNLKE